MSFRGDDGKLKKSIGELDRDRNANAGHVDDLCHRLKKISQDLEKAKQALAGLVNHRQVENKAIEQNLYTDLKKLVLPYLQKLEVCKSDRERQMYLEMIKTNLKNLMPQTSDTVFDKYRDLTPTEVKIADLIRQGRRTKEISEMLEMTPGSVFWYRNNIRKKLGLSHKKANLRNYLISLIP